jgi:hypothetical protein
VLYPTFYFDWAKTRLQWRRWPSARKPFTSARPVLVNTSLHDMRALTDPARIAKRFRPPGWARNIFFEFSPYNFVGPYSSERAIRGIWVYGDGRSFVFNVFGAERRKAWMGELTVFNWVRGHYEQLHEGGPDLRGLLALALSLIDEVRGGRAELVMPKRKKEYAQMLWDPIGAAEAT